MEYASIVASLPMLRFGEAPQLSLDDFLGNCALLKDSDREELDRILAGEREQLQSKFGRDWINADTQLRCAVVQKRAETTSVDAQPYLRDYQGFDMTTLKTVEDAFNAANPLDAERLLDQRRWALLDELAFNNEFGLPGVLAYAEKLKIALRWTSMDEEKAREVLEAFTVSNLVEEGTMARFLGENAAEDAT